ncbi:MAG TPA: hypothetical protein VFD35_12085 [Pricia sp.]|nr:hypothetical protein [Pricia sp.]
MARYGHWILSVDRPVPAEVEKTPPYDGKSNAPVFADPLRDRRQEQKVFHTSFRDIHFPIAPSIVETDLHGKYSKIYALARLCTR